ncbi:MAG: GIY-YIG nuclease family protein [Thermincola sp.]|jgi:molybdopterin-guanine dinucleotide biosynthesis protein|nr:GIY-YIG nuclease family protein [Thermincola sp.]MDT3702357.1 GIY-YIG nuclease family protein [Thermincola sp.]
MAKEFFPLRPEAHPAIYAYEDSNPEYRGLLKVGYTAINVEKRVEQQYPTKRPDGKKPYRIVFAESAMYSDGSSFTDHDIHRVLKKKGFASVGGEWFRCTVDDVKAAYIAVRDRTENEENRTRDFKMRPEQDEAVNKTIEYYKSAAKEKTQRTAKFLWNAKMRFGKTFAAYQLAKRMGMTKILILTFKPAVASAWSEDLLTHVDFEGWQFISKDGMAYEDADATKPIVCFGSFQDYLGTNDSGGIKAKNEWVHTTNWDLVIFDEYHFGAWRENARKLFEQEDEDSYDSLDIEKYKQEEADNAYNETFLPITTSRYLYLSGTPFRAINSGEFIEDQIYNWTYSDEQRAKENWGDTPDNPYASLPRMVMMTYKIPDSIRQIAMQGEFDEFDLNVFFSAKGRGDEAKFVYENEVQKWLDLIRGAYLGTTTDDLKLGAKKPEMPYSNNRLLSILTHTLWFLPNVSSCFAMKNLLLQRQNTFFHDYKVNVCAGSGAGIGVGALEPVQKSMGDPLKTKTITLSCGKLTTGVTVKPWTGIFMLRNLSSPETYFQAAFRVQSPWEIDTGAGNREIMKHECYVFDFALDRALKQISDYSCRLNVNEGNPEKKVEEFINFLPVIAYDGSTMKQISASDILDIAMAGTSATLLARRWESALLVNVDNETLSRLMANEDAMRALMSIEGFRSLNSDIQTIINLSDAVKKAKNKGEKLTPKEKKELSDEEKEYKSKRKLIQEKLIKFATRVPVFMYLTDFREYSLKDVITQLEPGLFKRVTGLNVKDFELLVSLGVFNGPLMNDAVYKFKRYEDSSLSYTGINKHEGENVGGYDTVLTSDEYKKLFASQQVSLAAVIQNFDDIPDVIDDYEDHDEEDDVPEEKPAKPSKAVVKTTFIKPEIRTPILQPATKVADPAGSSYQTNKNNQEISTIDYSEIKPGSSITHKSFGNGKVVRITEDKIIVSFGKAEKMFLFPDAIKNGFLKTEKH